jgi:hypothetical protein
MTGSEGTRPSRPGSTTWKLALIAIVLLGAALAVAMRSPAGDAAARSLAPGAVERAVDLTIPGAAASVAPAATGSQRFGQMLLITPSRTAVAKESGDEFAYGELAWRAELVTASLATEAPEISGYSLQAPEGMSIEVPPSVLGLLQASLPPAGAGSELSKLGSVSAEEARAQLESNLAVLEEALPPGALGEPRVEVVPVGGPNDGIALSVELEVGSRDALSKYFGDVFVGLQTGLVGGPDAVIDGLAIKVLEKGEPLVASWMAARAMAGTTMAAPGIRVPELQVVDLDFPDHTGGPVSTASATGKPAAVPSPTHPLPKLPTQKRLTLSSSGGAVRSAPGRVETPAGGDRASLAYRPNLRPRLEVSPGETIFISFSAPAHKVRVAVQRPNASGRAGVRIAQLSGRPASDNGLRWSVTLPAAAKLASATTLRIAAAYPAGSGRYLAGVGLIDPAW